MKDIILSIKPEYVQKIIDGTKKYEYRRRIAKENIRYIYIYSTYPVMKVVAKVEVTRVLSASPSSLWEKTKSMAGISREKYREYFKGCKIAYAYELKKVIAFDEPKELAEYNVTFVPQSFVYLSDEQGASR